MVGDGDMMALLYVSFPLQRKSHLIPEPRNRRVTRLPAFSKSLSFPLSFYPSFLLLSGPGVLCCGNEVETEA